MENKDNKAEKAEVKKAKSYAPTEAMKNNARRGLALREKWKRGGLSTAEAGEQGIGSGVARARDIINGNLSLESVKRMYAFFSRHEKNYQPKKKMPDGGPTAGTIAWLIWGGSSGLAWSRSILRQEDILKSYQKEITKAELEAEDNLLGVNLPITKAVNEEKRLATFLVLEPQDDDGTTNDLHQDWYDAEMVEKSCHNFNRYCMKANLLHLMPTSDIEFLESYIQKADCILGDKYIKRGSWLATIYVHETPEGDKIWEGIKSGYFNGLSIQAMGTVENIKE